MLFQLEILWFFSSFFYIVYYGLDVVYSWYKLRWEKKKEKQERQETRKKQQETAQLTQSTNDQNVRTPTRVMISPENLEKIREITKRAQINISRGYYDTARILIIEWLALKKHDKELNLLLADVYEREKNYKNAAFIYQDLLEIHKEDEYMLQRLWNIYALLWKNKKSFDTYQLALRKNRWNLEILDIISHLGLEIKDFKKSFKYACMYLKEKPRSAEKLWIKWYCLEKLWKSEEAIKAYKKVLELQPYNTEIQDRIKNLEK